MAGTPDCPPFHPGGDAVAASFFLRRASAADAIVELRDRGVRQVQTTCLLAVRAAVPWFAEALLQRVRAAGGVERPEVRPVPTVIRVGQVALTVAVTVLVAWAFVAAIAATP